MIKSLVILTTYRCNAKCDFCECGPGATPGLSLPQLIGYIDEAHSIGTIGQVIFSGGEPSLLREALPAAISHASSLGLLTRVVTNGSWGRSRGDADAYVRSLVDSGLTEINLSVDDFHQRWIPLERVRSAFHACLRQGLKCLIAHKALKGATITKEYLEDFFGTELVDHVEDGEYSAEEQLRLFSSGNVVPVGREPDQPSVRANLKYGPCGGSCSSVLKDIVLAPDHHLLACCGIVTKGLPELTLGDVSENRMIDVLKDANEDVVLNWLALEGPAAIAEFVASRDPTITFDDKYVNICHLCNDILTRPEVRKVLQATVQDVVGRVSLHRAVFESVRADEELSQLYT